MTKHSKNNTASSVFSYAEYKMAGKEYGTKRQRLGGESMRRFDSCSLCNSTARDPVACSEGHVFCKECVYTDLLTQKKDLKKQKDRLESMKRDAEEERIRAREAARERVLQDFEKGQLGLGSTPALPATSTSGTSNSEVARGTKRKFAFDATAVERLTQEAEEAALRQIEREQAESLKAKLPDFWLPSLTPTYSAPPSSLKDIKVQTACRASDPAHSLAVKNLIPVKFTYFSATSGESSSATKEQDEAMCPCCKKALSNNVKMFLMKPCGHVTCKTCTDTLVRPDKQCIVCNSSLDLKDLIEIKREGTGYAGGGLAEAVKSGTAFQG